MTHNVLTAALKIPLRRCSRPFLSPHAINVCLPQINFSLANLGWWLVCYLSKDSDLRTHLSLFFFGICFLLLLCLVLRSLILTQSVCMFFLFSPHLSGALNTRTFALQEVPCSDPVSKQTTSHLFLCPGLLGRPAHGRFDFLFDLRVIGERDHGFASFVICSCHCGSSWGRFCAWLNQPDVRSTWSSQELPNQNFCGWPMWKTSAFLSQSHVCNNGIFEKPIRKSDLLDIHRTLHPGTEECLFSSTQGPLGSELDLGC